MKMKRFKIVVYNSLGRCKYTYFGKYRTIAEVIDRYTTQCSRVIEVKEMGVRL
jgi:hypothetical protein